MKSCSKNTINIFCLLILTFSLVSCSAKVENQQNTETFNKVELNTGAVIANENGTYSNYNYDNGKYKKIDNSQIIGLYNQKSGNYVGQIDGKYFSCYNDKKIDLDNVTSSDSDFKLSPGGQKMSFFRDSDGINQPVIVNLQDGSEVQFNPEALISGTLLDFISDDKLIYYGVKVDTKENGLFTYDLNTNKEELLYKFKTGDAQFLKVLNDSIVFVQEIQNDDRQLIKIDINSNQSEVLSKNIVSVNDVVYSNGDYYVLGKLKNKSSSLFKINKNLEKRLIFDFPQSIIVDSGLVADGDGNILLIGSNVSQDQQEVYKCQSDGTISMVKDGATEYNFIK